METLLLTVYCIVVFYVLYQMALSLENKLEDKVTIVMDKKTLERQTKEQLSLQTKARGIDVRVKDIGIGKDKKVKAPALLFVLKSDQEIPVDPVSKEVQKALKMSDEALQEYLHEKITIRISPTNKQKLKPVVFLSVSINNDTANTQVYVDWDRSSVERFGQGSRAIRSTPNMPVDLSQPQVLTAINPGMTVVSNVTTEQRYSRNPATNQVEMPKPLVDLKQEVAMAKLTDPKKEDENIQPLYALDLMLSFKNRIEPDHEMVKVLLPFIFKMKIEVDKPAFPPLRWLLRHVGRNRKPLFWEKRARG